MFFDIVKLKKSSWHWRLHKWMYGTIFWDTPPLNLCPYFWIHVFTFLLSPVLLPLKLTIMILALLITGAVKAHDIGSSFLQDNFFVPLEKKRYAAKVQNLKYDDDFYAGLFELASYNDREIVEILNAKTSGEAWNKRYKFYDIDKDRHYAATRRMTDIIIAWKAANPNWKEILKAELDRREKYFEKLREEVEALREIQRKRDAKRAARKIKIRNAIVKYTSLFGPILIGITVCVGLYFLVKSAITWDWMAIVRFFGVGCASAIFVAMVILFLKFVISILGAAIVTDNIWSPVWRGLEISVLFLWEKVLGNIWKGIKFVFIMFFDWKKENCPGIEWED